VAKGARRDLASKPLAQEACQDDWDRLLMDPGIAAAVEFRAKISVSVRNGFSFLLGITGIRAMSVRI
jgi:hypothetical protein